LEDQSCGRESAHPGCGSGTDPALELCDAGSQLVNLAGQVALDARFIACRRLDHGPVNERFALPAWCNTTHNRGRFDTERHGERAGHASKLRHYLALAASDAG
jgi:hypothetical protein